MIDATLEFVRANQTYAGPIAFTLAALESLFIIGILLPGSTMLLAIGGLIGMGALPMGPILCWAILGAIFGDGISFLLGRIARPHIGHMPFLRRWQKHLDRAQTFIDRHGVASVALGRFFGPLRAIVPFVAGALGMPTLHYLCANIVSAIGWAPVWILPGTTVGWLIKWGGEGHTVATISLLLILACALFWVWRRRRNIAAR